MNIVSYLSTELGGDLPKFMKVLYETLNRKVTSKTVGGTENANAKNNDGSKHVSVFNRSWRHYNLQMYHSLSEQFCWCLIRFDIKCFTQFPFVLAKIKKLETNISYYYS